MAVNIKLRRKFEKHDPIDNGKITASIKGTQGNSFIELKIPIDVTAFNAGADANERSLSGLPKKLTILHNEVFISPVVNATAANNTEDHTSNLQIEISIVVPGKKPWEGGPL